MAELFLRNAGAITTTPVNDGNPLPISVLSLPEGETHDTGITNIPGIVAGAAYASGDAMGTKFQIGVPKSGYITTVLTVDLDKEQLDYDLLLFREDFTATADNAAMDVADGDHVKFVAHISVLSTHYAALNDSAVATTRLSPPLHYEAPEGRLYCQLVTRGAPNYTTANDLKVGVRVLPD